MIHGHSVSYIAEDTPGSPDKEVLQLSSRRDKILITSDKHFGELVFRRRKSVSGVLLVRLHEHTPAARASRVLEIIAHHGRTLQGAFTVITPHGVRIRKML